MRGKGDLFTCILLTIKVLVYDIRLEVEELLRLV